MILVLGISVEAAPKKNQKKRSKAAATRVVDLDAILEKPSKSEPEKARPQAMGALMEPRQLQAVVDAKLDEEIALAKQLIQFDNTCKGASPVRFRLGDLYWEKSKRAFFTSQDLDNNPKTRKRAKKKMATYQDQTIRWYVDIVKRCPGYTALPKVLYYLGSAHVELNRPKLGARYFKRIIQDHPASTWAPKAWFMVGEYYFDTVADIERALKAYERAREDRKHPAAGFAIYKEGWCYINTGEWELALRRFQDVIAWLDESNVLEPGPRQGLRREALKDFVRAYSNIRPEFSVKRLGEPGQAFDIFAKLVPKDEAAKMFEDLGLLYRGRDGHRQVVQVYEELTRRYPESARRVIWRSYVLEAVSRFGGRKQILAQLGTLGAMLEKAWQANESSPLVDKKRLVALQESFQTAERIVRTLGVERHKEGRRLRGKARRRSFIFAADVYDAYLGVFQNRTTNDVDYPYYVRFYQAELFLELGLEDKAADAFEDVAAMGESKENGREKKMAERAAKESVHAFERVLAEQRAAKTDGRIVAKTEDAFATAAERYLRLAGRSTGAATAKIRYKMARVFYDRSHFEKALEHFETLVARHPREKTACYAANLILDIHNGQKNYQVLAGRAKEFAGMKRLGCSRKERAQLALVAEQAAFGLLKQSAEDAKAGGVAQGYLDYYDRYPSSQLADDALYHAALAHEENGEHAAATKVRLKLVKNHPTSKLARETLFSMAAADENALEFVMARKLFSHFAKSYPTDDRAPVALLKVAQFAEALGDHDRAQRAYERVGVGHPDHPQAHLAGLKACGKLERELEAYRQDGFAPPAGRAKLLDKCYARWLSQESYRTRSPDLRCYVLTRRAQLYGGVLNNSTRGAAFQRDAQVVWQSIANNISATRHKCSNVRAEIGFRKLEQKFTELRRLQLSELNPTSARAIELFQASLGVVTQRRDELLREYQALVALGSETWSVAAAYRAGEVLLESVNKLVRAPIAVSLKLNDEDESLVREGLRDKAAPLRQLAYGQFRACLEVSQALGVQNAWVVKARAALAKLEPQIHGKTQERWLRPNVAQPGAGVLRLLRLDELKNVVTFNVPEVRGVRPMPERREPESEADSL